MPTSSFARGISFVKKNPQLFYTLFLLLVIPLAFFLTSEQFLRVARDGQDRSERQRIGLLQDTVAIFIKDHIADTAYLNERLSALRGGNETINRFQILESRPGGAYVTSVSLDANEVGTVFTAEDSTAQLFSLARGQTENSFASSFYEEGSRYWRAVRAVPIEGRIDPVYLVTDISMAESDRLAKKNIFEAYLILGVVILLILGLLARQAKIIDYAALYVRLKEVDQMKDDFVSMAAHELRAPLTIIRGYVDILRDMVSFPSDGRVHLQNIELATTQLNSLIGDILDVAKLQEGRMEFTFRNIDPNSVIASVVSAFIKPAEDKGLQLSYEEKPLPILSIDETRFRQVLINLVGNAVKYTPSGNVHVFARTSGERLEIRVSDTGLGISANEQQKLFQKFYRVKNSSTAKISGTGLGLWITAEIVYKMNGTISVESIEGKGSDFIVSFPIVLSK